MGKTLVGILFCLVLGLLGLGVTAWLVVSGKVIASLDTIFLTLVSLSLALACFAFIAWHFQAALATAGKKKKK